MARALIKVAKALAIVMAICVPPAQAAELLRRPVLVIDPGMHVATISALSTDAAGEIAATASMDGTVRIWDVATGDLRRTIRLPRATGYIGDNYVTAGRAFAVALSRDGSRVAVGGHMRYSDDDPQEQIYVYRVEDGSVESLIGGLPNVVLGLAFAPDGETLAAALGDNSGMRLYRNGADGWSESASDTSYAKRTNKVAFAPDGRFATTSFDGRVRLYDAAGALVASRRIEGRSPFGINFDAQGARLAVGFIDWGGVLVLDPEMLETVAEPEVGIDAEGSNTVVGWSADGALMAAGSRHHGETALISVWRDLDAPPVQLEAADSTIFGIAPASDGDLLVASADLQRLGSDGRSVWLQEAQQVDPRDQHSTLAVSRDGAIVDFRLGPHGERARFDVTARRLTIEPQEDGLTEVPDQSSLDLVNWNDAYTPRLDGRLIPLNDHETSRSVAIEPGGGEFVLGTDWNIRGYSAEGRPLWTRTAPGAAWAVNVSGDGRLVVAAYGDGTIRWHRMDDGVEILALFVLPASKDWVIWTPEGVYDATIPARAVLRWHVNREWDEASDAIPVSQIPLTLRPEVIPHVLPKLGTEGAFAVAEMTALRSAVKLATGASVAPGAQLHILTMGVSDYNDETAGHLDLKYADDDATDLANALFTSQSGLYARVIPQRLLNSQATRGGILRALRTLRDVMAQGDGTDLAVVHFSGHGAIADDSFYLLPYDVDVSDEVAISTTALDARTFQREIAEIAKHGRVIVLLDACRSGASTSGGQALSTDGDRLKSLMQGPNITVLTSSSANQDSREDDKWANGAFTEALLEALQTHTADSDANGILSMTEMTSFVLRRVAEITEGRQNPSVEMRFESAVFVAGT